LAAALASLALACGGEEKPTAAESAPAAAPSEPAQAEPGAAAGEMPAETMYEWDVTAGPPRDLAIDSADCQSQITGQGLAGVAQHIQCMKGKGWKTRQPAS
jgi:hypothetical protein